MSFDQDDKALLKWYTELFADFERNKGDIEPLDGMIVSAAMASMWTLKQIHTAKDTQALGEFLLNVRIIQGRSLERFFDKARKS